MPGWKAVGLYRLDRACDKVRLPKPHSPRNCEPEHDGSNSDDTGLEIHNRASGHVIQYMYGDASTNFFSPPTFCCSHGLNLGSRMQVTSAVSKVQASLTL